MGVWWVTYGTDKGSVPVANDHADTSETCWCKVATEKIVNHSASIYSSVLLSRRPYSASK